MEKIQVVLASPSDLQEERQMIRELVNSMNPLYMKNDICIDLRMWENVTPGMNADGPQGVIDIDLEIPKADLFICLYWKRIGTFLRNEDIAGTEHELNLALESYHKRRKPDIKAFFKNVASEEESEDIDKIRTIAKKLQPLGLYTPFASLEELKTTINQILQSEVMQRIKKQAAIVPEIHKYIEVSIPNEFISNLASNNKLVLDKGYFDILDFDVVNENARKIDVFDGKELVVSDLSNITIVGDNTTLLVRPRFANVINFKNCSNIKLIGLTLGHTPQKGSCSGAVLHFENCNNIQLDSLELFGCGTYGIVLENCKNVHVNGTKIYECTYGALYINQSDIEFSNSMIFDCNKIMGCLIEAYDSQLDFNNVAIFNNYIDNFLISLETSTLFCQAVCIHSNAFAKLCNEELSFGVFLEGNIIEGEDEWNLTVSSTSAVTIEVYDEIKELLLSYGTISESVFEDGNMYINVFVTSEEQISILSEILHSTYDNLSLGCG